MKKIFTVFLSVAAMALAENVQVLEPSGAEFSTDAPQVVMSILRSAVAQTGNTPVESSADIQIRTTLSTMGSSIVVVVEQLKDGTVVGSGRQKTPTVDDLDVAIDNAVKAALANLDAGNAPQSAAYAPEAGYQDGPDVVYVVPVERRSSEDPNDNFAHKRPTRNYVSYGLGMAMWHNYDFENDDYEVEMSWEQAFVFHYARIFEVVPHAAITIINNMNISFGSDWEWHETFLIGGRYFVSTGNITPYIGLGGGLGIQTDEHYEAAAEGFAIGLATGAELGIIFFRNSATQLELGLAWDALWDGFESFDRRFGSGSFYVAINY
ncbi:MAG: hypothetical protein IKC23_11225 [Fibrobacter sp.]|nr:hypothetical protein [Fibrobacter sp.]MBR3851253.1 hypothetical protein [Fibrobacter sp.]